jgi:hypothetical protein
MNSVKFEVISLDSPQTRRVKLRWGVEVLCLGNIEDFSALQRIAREALAPYNLPSFCMTFLDEDQEELTITTQAAFSEVLGLSTGTLYFQVSVQDSLRRSDPPANDLEFSVKAAYDALSAVFRVVSSSRVIGVGCLVAEGIGLVAHRTLLDLPAVQAASILFEDPDFQYELNTLKPVGDHLAYVSFKAPLSIKAKVLPLSTSSMAEGEVFYTLAKPEKHDIKANLLRVEVKELQVPDLRIFVTKEACGPVGSPLFDSAFRLAGMLLTEYAYRSEGISLSRLPPPSHSDLFVPT